MRKVRLVGLILNFVNVVIKIVLIILFVKIGSDY